MPNTPRAIPMEGASNVRDLGGVPTKDGGTVRRGLVFRSAALNRLTEKDRQHLLNLGVKTVVDVRSRSERRDARSKLPGHITVITPGDGGIGAQPISVQNARPHSASEAVARMVEGYQSYPARMTTAANALLHTLETEASGGVLFHCTAGKDRTGFLAAIVLDVLGVAEADIMADYLATNEQWDKKSARLSFLPKDALDVILTAKPEFLAAALETVHTQYGSSPGYLTAECDVSEDTIARVRARLIA